MDIFKKIFGGRKEPKRSTIRFDALDSWLEEKESRLNGKVSVEGRPLYTETSAALRDARRLIEEIYNSEPPSEAPRALKGQIMKACRRFGKGAIAIIEDIILESPNTFEEFDSFHRSLVESLSKIRSLSQIHGRLISASRPSLFRTLMGRLRRLSSQIERLEACLSSNRQEYDSLKEIRENKEDVEERIRHLKTLKNSLLESEGLAEDAWKASEEIKVQLREIEESEGYLGLLDQNRKIEELEGKLERFEKSIYGVLGPMARTLRKFRKYVYEDEYTLNKETLGALNEYISQPLEAFLMEEEGLPLLTEICVGVNALIERGTLNIKIRRREKILHNLERILGGELTSFQRDYNQMKDKAALIRKKLTSSPLISQKDKLREDLQVKMESIKRLKDEKQSMIDLESMVEHELSSLRIRLEEGIARVEGRPIEVKIEMP